MFFTLNLDQLAERAFSLQNPGKALTSVSGPRIAYHAHLFKSPTPSVFHLHGTLADAGSWVFTQEDLHALLNHEGYAQVMRACFLTRTILFVGISVDDIAVGGHLAYLRDQAIDAGCHYWLTHRQDAEATEWAQSANVRIIHYPVSDEDGHSAVDGFFADLNSYIPEEAEAPPVAPPPADKLRDALPDPEELISLDAESIREILNEYAAEVLKRPTQEAYEKYATFCREYDDAIYRAWYVSTEPAKNQLLGYSLSKRIAHGAFGTVYEALSPSGKKVAVKVLHGRIRSEPQMLQGFRRGVRSMQILSKHEVEGMVPYIEAAEIPAFVVMELVDGPDLHEAVTRRLVDGWHDILSIAVDIATILRRSHSLPERVLHRDLRPQNVMLRGAYSEADWEVVLLDFDLSWHIDAAEVSVVSQNTVGGYLAPEQVTLTRGCSTRSAAIDSYGLGMTLFFLASGADPIASQHRFSDWADVLQTQVGDKACRSWASLPRRFSRLIFNATRHSQAERWDLAQIYGELSRLQEAERSPRAVQSPELLAEELAVQTCPDSGYCWDEEAVRARMELPSGVIIEIRPDNSASSVYLDIRWQKSGHQEHKKIGKWVKKAAEQARSALSKGGWRDCGNTFNSNSISLGANMQVNALRNRIGEAASSLSKAVAALAFD